MVNVLTEVRVWLLANPWKAVIAVSNTVVGRIKTISEEMLHNGRWSKDDKDQDSNISLEIIIIIPIPQKDYNIGFVTSEGDRSPP